MMQAGLEYDQCTAEELGQIVQHSGKPLWQLLAQVEESKWNNKLANEIRQNVGEQRSFFKVVLQRGTCVAARRLILVWS